MVAEAEIVCIQSLPVLDVHYFQEVEDVAAVPPLSPRCFSQIRVSEPVPADLAISQADKKAGVKIPDDISQYFPHIRSGSFSDIGPRRYMEDEHIRIDDLSTHLESVFKFPQPNAFYGVFDGHGGHEAAAYVRKNIVRILFEDADFPQTSEVNDIFLEEVQHSIREAFILADLALADDCSVNCSSGTTALAAIIFGRLLMVANAGDCRAVLCRKGEAIDMSQDHKPIHPQEKRRVQALGGYVDDGYLNGVLSVSRALGDWDMKFPRGSPKPLIAEPEFRQIVLTEDDEFLIMGCDGIWDVMSSRQAVSLVRRGLRRHDDPEQCAKDLVREALRLNTFDNLTVIVICFSSHDQQDPSPPQTRLRCCSISAEALCNLRSLLDGSGSR